MGVLSCTIISMSLMCRLEGLLLLFPGLAMCVVLAERLKPPVMMDRWVGLLQEVSATVHNSKQYIELH
jgi:hypothetical protein